MPKHHYSKEHWHSESQARCILNLGTGWQWEGSLTLWPLNPPSATERPQSMLYVGRGQLKCDGTRAETTLVFRRNGRVHLNRWGASVQSTTGSRGVRISGSNAGHTMFRALEARKYYRSSFSSPYKYRDFGLDHRHIQKYKNCEFVLTTHSICQFSRSLPLPCVTVCHHISTGVYNIRIK